MRLPAVNAIRWISPVAWQERWATPLTIGQIQAQVSRIGRRESSCPVYRILVAQKHISQLAQLLHTFTFTYLPTQIFHQSRDLRIQGVRAFNYTSTIKKQLYLTFRLDALSRVEVGSHLWWTSGLWNRFSSHLSRDSSGFLLSLIQIIGGLCAAPSSYFLTSFLATNFTTPRRPLLSAPRSFNKSFTAHIFTHHPQFSNQSRARFS